MCLGTCPFGNLFIMPIFTCAGLMVKDGYVALGPTGRPIQGAAPPPEWNSVEHVWAFDYTRCVCVCVCVLQRLACNRGVLAWPEVRVCWLEQRDRQHQQTPVHALHAVPFHESQFEG